MLTFENGMEEEIRGVEVVCKLLGGFIIWARRHLFRLSIIFLWFQCQGMMLFAYR